jgi:hypothetical protein
MPKSGSYRVYFEDLYFVRFLTKLILKSQRNLPENIKKEAIWKTAMPMKNSSEILNSRNIPKKLLFSG